MNPVNTLMLDEPDFPGVLAQIPSPPEAIYWEGNEPESWLDKPRVAVVGSRKISAYGRGTTSTLVSQMVREGIVIISGLAYGVDICAHRAALEAGGTTVAVLPSSLDQVYPAGHRQIARQIIRHGTLISEYPPGSVISYKSNFIARNRIVSGLADAVLITEAAINSGSLHTARFALEQGKTVMAVPGNINSPTSQGCNNLIKSGATPVTDISDVLFALKIPAGHQQSRRSPGNPEQQKIYHLIKQGVSAQEELALAAEVAIPEVTSAITMLEISGYIRPTGGGNWIVA